jgi:4-alpha-glucanotransferase
MQRASGILLHPTSLHTPYGIGDLGESAYRLVDFLNSAGQRVWQILPTGPTGYGDSPYNTLSAFAGNPLLIDLEALVTLGDLSSDDLKQAEMSPGPVDFHMTRINKMRALEKAGRSFLKHATATRRQDFECFCAAHDSWLTDFSLFMALRDHFSARSWADWPTDLRERDRDTLHVWQGRLEEPCQLHRYQQFIFYQQWHALKSYANQQGILLFGDIPIFVAYDSAEVWARPHLFQLDTHGRPTVVAGVPPDYFSATGQRWGNPLYRWDRHQEDDFDWWMNRMRWNLEAADLVRIDHFRGFSACWTIPASEKTAINGHWAPAPGHQLFQRLRRDHPNPPIIAEDLGIITPDVEQLRQEFGFPGMKILQFAFDSGPENPYLPQNYTSDCVVYTGTHDNNTTLGWWRSITKEHRSEVRQQLGKSRLDMPWDLIQMAAESCADLCIIPCQDILGLGPSGRLNRPGYATGNWTWRLQEGQLDKDLAGRLMRLCCETLRNPTGERR